MKPTTILLVTFECVGNIQWFLADINCIQQEVVRCKFYANFVIINTWHARWRHIRSTRHWNHWANGGKWPQNSPLPLEALRPPLTHECLGHPTHRLKRQLDRCTHFRTTMQQSHTVWNTIAYLRRQNVTFIEPPSSPDLNRVNYAIWVILHFLLYAVYMCQKSLNFTYAFKCYQQNCSWLHFTWPTPYIVTTFIFQCERGSLWESCLDGIQSSVCSQCLEAIQQRLECCSPGLTCFNLL